MGVAASATAGFEEAKQVVAVAFDGMKEAQEAAKQAAGEWWSYLSGK
jgi:hypothetical protein